MARGEERIGSTTPMPMTARDIESNYCRHFSHDLSQPAGFPTPRSMLSRDRSMPLHAWNLSGTEENVFGNPRSVFDSSQTPYRGILHASNQSATGAIPVQVSTGTPVARGEERIGSTTAMPMSERRPSTMNSFLPAEIPQNSVAGQQRQQISELQFDSFPTSSSLSCWKKGIKSQVSSCSDFPQKLW